MNEVSEVPDPVLRVLQRWNPSAGPDGCQFDETFSGTYVYVVGPSRCGTDDIRRALGVADECSVVASAADADVVVLVVDAASVIGREDLASVEEAAVSGTPLVVALTGMYVYQDWQAVRRRDAEVLAAHCAEFDQTPIVPFVSGEEPALVAVVVRRGRESTATRSTGGVIAQTRRMIESEIRNLRDSPVGADLREERARLLADRDGRRGERMVQVRGRIQRVRGDLSQHIADATRSTVASAHSWIDGASRIELDHLSELLQHEVDQHTSALDTATESALEVTGAEGSAAPRLREDPPLRRRGIEERVTILVGASAGLGLGRIAVTPLEMIPALDFASIPVTLVMGGWAAWWLTRSRGLMADRAHARAWVAESMSAVRAQWDQRIQQALLEAEEDLGAAVIADSRDSLASTQARIVEIDGELRELSAARAGQLASCEKDLLLLNESCPQGRARIGTPRS